MIIGKMQPWSQQTSLGVWHADPVIDSFYPHGYNEVTSVKSDTLDSFWPLAKFFSIRRKRKAQSVAPSLVASESPGNL